MVELPGNLIVLGVETSCDDTSAAVLRGPEVLSSVVSSQIRLHAPYGGVVPELASREHIRNIRPVVQEALETAGVTVSQVELVVVTRGPGLIGSLLVGLNYAKGFAASRGIPLVAVNHLEGHFNSPFLEHPDTPFPALALLVSGGHTCLYWSERHGHYELLAGTRDDAAGEAYDKTAKLLGLPYPGGPVIDRLAREFEGEAVRFRMPKISDGSLDFSFSGLKTQVLHLVQAGKARPCEPEGTPDGETLSVLRGFQDAVVHQLLDRIRHYAKERKPRSLLLGGGVACNSALRAACAKFGEKAGLAVAFPSPRYSTDNAAMIALAGLRHFAAGRRDPLDVNATASLALEDEG